MGGLMGGGRPLLQVALDLTDTDEAVRVARAAAPHVDVVEAGTLLCLARGMAAVGALREAAPKARLLADIRIVRAGEKLAGLAFEAGADWVTVVAEAPRETLEAACEVAAARGGEVQVELADTFADEDARRWRDLGIRQVIAHNTAEHGTVGQGWSRRSLDDVARLAEHGFDVSVTGGIAPGTIPTFAGLPVHLFIAGRGIWAADDPAAAARDYREAIAALDGAATLDGTMARDEAPRTAASPGGGEGA